MLDDTEIVGDIGGLPLFVEQRCEGWNVHA